MSEDLEIAGISPVKTSGFRFLSEFRLHKTDEFSSVFAFRRSIKGRYFILSYLPNAHPYARLGVVVAKKLAKRAVERNRVKRQVREFYRLNRETIPSVDIILRLNARIDEVPNETLREDLQNICRRLRALPGLKAA